MYPYLKYNILTGINIKLTRLPCHPTDDGRAIIFIKIAMKKWNQKTCILFVPRTSETNYLNFVPGK